MKNSYLILLSIFFILGMSPDIKKNNRAPASIDAPEQEIQEIEIIRRRITADLLPSFKESNEKVELWLTELEMKGKWSDFDYQTQSGVSWGPVLHLARVRTLSGVYHSPDSKFYHSLRLLNVMIKAIDYFIDNNFTSYNWWYNEIGVPLNIGHTMMVMKNDLPRDLLIKYSSFFMRRGLSIPPTGQNLVWMAQVILYRGVIDDDTQSIAESRRLVESVIRLNKYVGLGKDEGLFPDFSFIQHDWVFYNFGYGLYFSDTISQFIYYLKETSLQFTGEKLQLFLDFVALGQLSMTRRSTLDYSGQGRSHVRKNVENSSLMAVICKRLLDIPSTHAELFKKCSVDILAGSFSQELNRYFWNGDYMVHQRKDFMISVKMHSERIANNDQPSNGEGLRSTHLSDGATFIYRTGSEYRNIFPAWDYRKVPGTTAFNEPWPEVKSVGPYHDFRGVFDYSPNPSGYVGGVSDGQNGFATAIFNKFGVYEKKSYFFNDDGLVVIGSDLKTDSRSYDLNSSINQIWLEGDVYYQLTNTSADLIEKLDKNQTVEGDLNWIHHGETLYLTPGNSNLILSNKIQEGNINLISGQQASEITKGNIFNLSLKRSQNQSSYSYSVHPQIKLDKAREFAKNPPYTIVSASNDVHALSYRNNLFQASFFRPGTLPISKDWPFQIKVSDPVAIQLQGKNFTDMVIYISDPTRNLESAEIELTDTQGISIRKRVSFPQAPGYIGQPVKIQF